MLEKISNKSLVIVALSIGVGCSSVLMSEVEMRRSKLKKLKFYRKAMHLILTNPIWPKEIGEPLMIREVKIWNHEKNKFKAFEAKVSVPFFGTHYKGEFELQAKRDNVEKEYLLTKISMITKVNNEDKKVILFKT